MPQIILNMNLPSNEIEMGQDLVLLKEYTHRYSNHIFTGNVTYFFLFHITFQDNLNQVSIRYPVIFPDRSYINTLSVKTPR